MFRRNASNLLVLVAVAALCLLGRHPRGRIGRVGLPAFSNDCDLDTHAAATRWERTEQESIRETVFRRQLQQEKADGSPAPTCFLWPAPGQRAPRSAPDPILLRRLAGDGFRVAAGVQCAFQPDATVRDRATGDRGVNLEQSAIRWIGPHEVEVDGSRYQSPRREASAIYRLVCRAGVWRVTGVAPFES